MVARCSSVPAVGASVVRMWAGAGAGVLYCVERWVGTAVGVAGSPRLLLQGVGVSMVGVQGTKLLHPHLRFHPLGVRRDNSHPRPRAGRGNFHSGGSRNSVLRSLGVTHAWGKPRPLGVRGIRHPRPSGVDVGVTHGRKARRRPWLQLARLKVRRSRLAAGRDCWI